jgi:hypothetical protein
MTTLESNQEAENEAERTRLIANIEQASPLSADFLQTQTLDSLKILANSYKGRDFSGASGTLTPQFNGVTVVGERPMGAIKEA